TLAIGPVVGVPDLTEAFSRFIVAERPCKPGVVRRARRDAERGGGLVIARQVGLEDRWIVGRDGAADAGRHELRQWVLLEGAHDAEPEVGDRTHVEHGAAICKLSDEAGILDGANAVADPVCSELLERAADGLGSDPLPRGRPRPQPALTRERERLGVRLRRVAFLGAAES